MIGLFRPLNNNLQKTELAKVKQIHCSGCVSLRRFGSWPSTLAYPYETDLLNWLIFGFGNLKSNIKHLPCTAMPLIPKTVLTFPKKYQDISGAFSVLVGWATASDHERDENSRLSKFLRKRLDPHLETALATLDITPGTPPDPRLLSELDESKGNTIEGLTSLYRPFVSGLWKSAFLSTGIPALTGERGQSLADNLSDVMLVSDAWIDRQTDHLNGYPNPFSPNATNEADGYLEQKLKELTLLTHGAKEPYGAILRSVFKDGVGARIWKMQNLKGRKLEKSNDAK